VVVIETILLRRSFYLPFLQTTLDRDQVDSAGAACLRQTVRDDDGQLVSDRLTVLVRGETHVGQQRQFLSGRHNFPQHTVRYVDYSERVASRLGALEFYQWPFRACGRRLLQITGSHRFGRWVLIFVENQKCEPGSAGHRFLFSGAEDLSRSLPRQSTAIKDDVRQDVDMFAEISIGRKDAEHVSGFQLKTFAGDREIPRRIERTDGGMVLDCDRLSDGDLVIAGSQCGLMELQKLHRLGFLL